MKETVRLGSVSPTKEHQSGTVISRGGYPLHNIPYNGKTQSRLYGELAVLGGIGINERVNRDSKRVLGGYGCMYSLKAHIALEQPLVVKKWKEY